MAELDPATRCAHVCARRRRPFHHEDTKRTKAHKAFVQLRRLRVFVVKNKMSIAPPREDWVAGSSPAMMT
jgi:hypothetical protein